jgi:DHA1 family multidrug resistance protein-like MFS transporter
MCAVIAVNQLGFGAIIPTMPLYAESFGVSFSAIGVSVAIYGLARFLVAIPTGRLADQLGRRPTLALGGLVSTVGNIWCAGATGYYEFLAARFVAGAGATLVLTTGIVIIADISTPAVRGRMMAVYQGAFLFAVGIGPFPGGVLAEHYGLAAPFLAYAVAGVVVGTIAWFAVAESRDFGANSADGSANVVLPPCLTQMRLLTAQIGFLLVCAIAFMNAVVRTGAMFTIVPVLGRDQLALSASQVGFGMAIGSVLGLMVAYPSGVLVDRYGRKMIIVPATMLTGVSLLIFCFAANYGWFVLGSVVWGVASAVAGAAPSAYAADTAPPGMNASAMSTYRMLADAGYVVGPIVLGLTVDWYGASIALIVAAALKFSMSALFARYAPETYAARRQP